MNGHQTSELQKTKYLHIIPMDIMYAINIVKMINENPLDFNIDDHLFIVTSITLYTKLKHYSNVRYEPEILKMKCRKKLFKYSSCSHYVFMHSLPFSFGQMIFLKRDTANKIVWCVWGHDLYRKRPIVKGMGIYRKLRRVVFHHLFDLIYASKIKQFHAIGIGFKYDALEIRRLFDNTPIVMAPYGFNYPKSDVDKAIDKYKSTEKEKNVDIKIMIGHSSFPFLKHEEILNRLLKYKEKNIKIVIPLSYGDEQYGLHIEKLAKQMFKEKAVIVKEFMSLTDYIEFLLTVDIAIFDYDHQSALGNIILLLYLGKKVYLSPKGIIHFAMRAEGIKTYNANAIGSVRFEVLEEQHAFDEKAVMYSGYYLNEKNIIDLWKTTLEELQ